MRWLSRLTTVAVIVIVVAAAALLLRSQVPETSVGGDFVTYVMFRDASRLAPGSAVVIAGVRVGDIAGLTIEGGLARVELRLRDDIKLPADSFATRRADSLFGDSYIEIIPGEDDRRTLRPGEPIPHVEEGGSTDTALRAIARTMPKIDSALETAQQAMVDGRKYISGPLLDRINRADRWLADGNLERPLAAADRAMERFEDATTRGAAAIADAAPGIRRRLTSFDEGVVSATARIREVRDGMVTGLRDARAGFDRIDPVVEQMSEVVTAIDRGSGDDWRGTLGRLVNEPELADTIEEASEAGVEAFAGFNRFRSWLGLAIEASPVTGSTRFYGIAELSTRTDKFYLVELEKSDLGSVPDDTLSEVPNSDGFIRRQSITDRMRFTAQFGKRFGWFQVRGGLKFSTIGFGADAVLLGSRMRLSADVFGSFQIPPRVRLAASFAVFRSVYVLAGVDDVLNEPRDLRIITGNTPVPYLFTTLHHGRDYFLGGALRFDDADLSVLLRIYGALLAATLGG